MAIAPLPHHVSLWPDSVDLNVALSEDTGGSKATGRCDRERVGPDSRLAVVLDIDSVRRLLSVYLGVAREAGAVSCLRILRDIKAPDVSRVPDNVAVPANAMCVAEYLEAKDHTAGRRRVHDLASASRLARRTNRSGRGEEL